MIHWLEKAFAREASTRTAALMRIGAVIIAWMRLADGLIIYNTWTRPPFLALSVVFFTLTTLAIIGLWTRVVMPLLALMFLYMVYGMGISGGVEPYTHHHIHCLALTFVWLAFTPSGRSYSLDRWLVVRRARREGRPPPAEVGPVWGLYLLMMQTTVIYVFGAWDKSFLGYGERMEMTLQSAYFGSDLPWAGWRPILSSLGFATVLLEWALAFGLWIRRWHRWLIPAGILLHIGIYDLLPVSIFSANMMLLYVAFLDPNAVHRFLEELTGHPPRAPGDTAPVIPRTH